MLLGDVLELRHGPLREAMAAARPFFEDLGRALGGARAGARRRQPRPRAGRTVAGSARRRAATRRRWGSSSCSSRAHASPALRADRRLGRAGARVRVAYPGLWVRADVYATHGHYLDCHLTVPTLERLSVGVMSRLLGRPRGHVRRRRRLRGDGRARVRLARRGRARQPHRQRAQRPGDRQRLERAGRRRAPRAAATGAPRAAAVLGARAAPNGRGRRVARDCAAVRWSPPSRWPSPR